VSNTPVVRTNEQQKAELTTFEFEQSPPMPSYLVGIGVGPFDVLEGPEKPVKIRLLATQKKAALGKLAIETAQKQLELLASYFGSPYPYKKLDLIAVPNFAAGAMENPGFITFREELVLLDPERAATASRRSLVGVTAHELAHQWFGNLVTMAWWDDVWLNEGFATWMANKIVDQYDPGFLAGRDAVGRKADVMSIDSLSSARKVRQPVQSTSEALEAFDASPT
jgi:alanyl aminopeptidase